MNARELLDRIEADGGSLSLLEDGRLRWENVLPEHLAQVPALKSEIVSLMQERAKPQYWPSIFTPEELDECRRIAMAEEQAKRLRTFAAMQTDAAPSPAPAEKSFTYVSREPAFARKAYSGRREETTAAVLEKGVRHPMSELKRQWTVKELKQVLKDVPDTTPVRIVECEIEGAEGDWQRMGAGEGCEFWLFASSTTVKPEQPLRRKDRP